MSIVFICGGVGFGFGVVLETDVFVGLVDSDLLSDFCLFNSSISDDKFINAILKVQQNLATCPNTFIQYGAIKALSGGEGFVKKALNVYQKNVDILIREFKKISNFRLVEPEGSLFALIDVSKVNKNSYDFCLDLLDYISLEIQLTS